MTVKQRADKSSNKLSNQLWRAHESLYGRNDLSTMTKFFGEDYDIFYPSSNVYDRDISQNEQPIDEFGGLPDHFDVSERHRKFTMEAELFDLSVGDESDFVVSIDPLKVLRAARFVEIAGRKIKRVDRPGRTTTHQSSGRTYKERRANKDKTAAKRQCRRLFAETIPVIEEERKMRRQNLPMHLKMTLRRLENRMWYPRTNQLDWSEGAFAWEDLRYVLSTWDVIISNGIEWIAKATQI